MSDRSNCQRVDVEGAAAFDLGSSRYILVWGTRPSPCWEPDVRPIRMPNTYEVYLCERTDTVCIQVVGPYVGYLETNANAASSVTILGPGGSRKVPVVKAKIWGDVLAALPPTARTAWVGSPAADAAPVAGLAAAAPTPCEGVGTSATFSFEEAFMAAVHNAHPPGPNYPDRLLTFTVQEIGARFGGIAGVRHLFVRVRCTSG